MPKARSIGGAKHWLLILDDHSDCSTSFFIKRKDELAERVLTFVKNLVRILGRPVKKIRCDNAGENTALEKQSKKEGISIFF